MILIHLGFSRIVRIVSRANTVWVPLSVVCLVPLAHTHPIQGRHSATCVLLERIRPPLVEPSQVLLKPHVEDRQEKEIAKALQKEPPVYNCALTTLEVIAHLSSVVAAPLPPLITLSHTKMN